MSGSDTDKMEAPSGSCFWGHKWSKWVEYVVGMTHIGTGEKCKKWIQKRACLRCGKIREREI